MGLFTDIRLLYLVERRLYLYKTSRVRFHALQAIAKECTVHISGVGWKDYDPEKTLNENIDAIYKDLRKPDMIFCYKPFKINGFNEISIPSCVSYNEMNTKTHPIHYTIREIMENRIDLVICHHLNEMLYKEFSTLPCRMVNIAHCGEKTLFKDYHLPKDIDVLLVGGIHEMRYPLRARLLKLLKKMRTHPKFEKYTIGVLRFPGIRHRKAYTDKQVIKYAKEINRTKICLTCSGRYCSRYAKYVEIPLSHSLLMADLPDEDHAFFGKFMAVIDNGETDEEIVNKILYYLENDLERERLTDLGYQLTCSQYTQEDYAKRFLTAVKDFLKDYGGKKLPYWRE